MRRLKNRQIKTPAFNNLPNRKLRIIQVVITYADYGATPI
jgi:hypothetical protein